MSRAAVVIAAAAVVSSLLLYRLMKPAGEKRVQQGKTQGGPHKILYRSTRGGVSGVTFQDCLLSGYAPDGGLFVPEHMPTITLAQLRSWQTLTFAQLATTIMHIFAGDEIPIHDLAEVMEEAFCEFTCEEIVPLVEHGGIHVAELFHGPTLAFKDFGQQMMCGLIAYFAAKKDQHATLLVSTTGDTGPAAIAAVAGKPGISIFCHFPEGQVSTLQRLQMTSVAAANVTVIRFQGGGDDMDKPIKELTTDPAFVKKHKPCGINSINLGRVTSQTVHFVWAYLELCRRGTINVGEAVTFAVPCGALGNITAGIFARRMGLPIHSFHCGVNDNDIFDRAVSLGQFHKAPLVKTMSEAINIQVPYNFERIMYFLLDENTAATSEWMLALEAEDKADVPPAQLRALQALVKTTSVNDTVMCATIHKAWTDDNYLLDPHSAVGLAAAYALSELREGRQTILLATAHAAKFESAVRHALGDRFWEQDMDRLMPASGRAVLTRPECHDIVFKAGDNWREQLRTLVDQSAR